MKTDMSPPVISSSDSDKQTAESSAQPTRRSMRISVDLSTFSPDETPVFSYTKLLKDAEQGGGDNRNNSTSNQETFLYDQDLKNNLIKSEETLVYPKKPGVFFVNTVPLDTNDKIGEDSLPESYEKSKSTSIVEDAVSSQSIIINASKIDGEPNENNVESKPIDNATSTSGGLICNSTGSDTGLDSLIKVEVPVLPEGLCTEIHDNVSELKKIACEFRNISQSSRSKFFSGAVNDILYRLETLCRRDLTASKKKKVYTHLAHFLPFTRLTLVSRANKLIEKRTRDQTANPEQVTAAGYNEDPGPFMSEPPKHSFNIISIAGGDSEKALNSEFLSSIHSSFPKDWYGRPENDRSQTSDVFKMDVASYHSSAANEPKMKKKKTSKKAKLPNEDPSDILKKTTSTKSKDSTPENTALPENLSPEINELIDKLKAAGSMNVIGKGFFSAEINSLLYRLEILARAELPKPIKSRMYSHLASCLPTNKKLLSARIKRMFVTTDKPGIDVKYVASKSSSPGVENQVLMERIQDQRWPVIIHQDMEESKSSDKVITFEEQEKQLHEETTAATSILTKLITEDSVGSQQLDEVLQDIEVLNQMCEDSTVTIHDKP